MENKHLCDLCVIYVSCLHKDLLCLPSCAMDLLCGSILRNIFFDWMVQPPNVSSKHFCSTNDLFQKNVLCLNSPICRKHYVSKSKLESVTMVLQHVHVFSAQKIFPTVQAGSLPVINKAFIPYRNGRKLDYMGFTCFFLFPL